MWGYSIEVQSLGRREESLGAVQRCSCPAMGDLVQVVE